MTDAPPIITNEDAAIDSAFFCSHVSERAYLLAMLFGREFEVEANDLSMQIASLAMTMVEPDGSAALIARVHLVAAD